MEQLEEETLYYFSKGLFVSSVSGLLGMIVATALLFVPFLPYRATSYKGLCEGRRGLVLAVERVVKDGGSERSACLLLLLHHF